MGIKVVRPDLDLMLITAGGTIIRTNVSQISLISRNTQGVKIMDMTNDDKVTAMATANRQEQEEEA